MFTPVFAVARTVGWVAHWNEMIAGPETRLSRPRQLYTGPAERAVVPIAERDAPAVRRVSPAQTIYPPFAHAGPAPI
jgi:hypothetical protein